MINRIVHLIIAEALKRRTKDYDFLRTVHSVQMEIMLKICNLSSKFREYEKNVKKD